jgi:hypothetical protein
MGQDAAFEEGFELVLDQLRQAGAAAASAYIKKVAVLLPAAFGRRVSASVGR